MPELLQVVVCDDHPLFRSGVVNCLASSPDIAVAAEAADGEACIAKLQLVRPDILIADLSMPYVDGFEVLKWVGENQPGVRVIILSMHTGMAYVKKAMALGACAFIAKEDAQTELLAAIEHKPGKFYMSESIGRPARVLLQGSEEEDHGELLSRVSDAEKKVLVLLSQSMTSREISESLNLSVRTVQAHRANLASKLEVKGHNKLLEFAIRHRQQIQRLTPQDAR